MPEKKKTDWHEIAMAFTPELAVLVAVISAAILSFIVVEVGRFITH